MEVGIEVFCEMGKQIDVSASVDISNLSSVLSVGDMFLLLKNWRKPALVELKAWLDDFLDNLDDTEEVNGKNRGGYDIDEIADLLTLDDICDLIERLQPRQQEFVYTWMRHIFDKPVSRV